MSWWAISQTDLFDPCVLFCWLLPWGLYKAKLFRAQIAGKYSWNTQCQYQAYNLGTIGVIICNTSIHNNLAYCKLELHCPIILMSFTCTVGLSNWHSIGRKNQKDNLKLITLLQVFKEIARSSNKCKINACNSSLSILNYLWD